MDVEPAPIGETPVQNTAEGAVSRCGSTPQAPVVFAHMVRVGGRAEKQRRFFAYGAESRMEKSSGKNAEVLPAQISKDAHVWPAAEFWLVGEPLPRRRHVLGDLDIFEALAGTDRILFYPRSHFVDTDIERDILDEIPELGFHLVVA